MAVCTLFDANYLVEGVMCIRSSFRWLRQPFYVLCLDPLTFRIGQMLSCENGYVMPINFYDFEQDYLDLFKSRSTRPWNAYTQTVKVFLPKYLFDRFNVSDLIYIDSDMLFWSDLTAIEYELGTYSFMVASRELNPCPPQGCYNGGFFACKNDNRAKVFLKWWQDKVLDWCLWEKGGEDQFTEEGYLNVFSKDPDQFSGIHISNHPGINLAPWNVGNHVVKVLDDCSVAVDDEYPLVCYHYRGWVLGKCGDCFDPGTHIQSNGVWHIYETYHREFRKTKQELLDVMDEQWR